jgi:hypothetical protein
MHTARLELLASRPRFSKAAISLESAPVLPSCSETRRPDVCRGIVRGPHPNPSTARRTKVPSASTEAARPQTLAKFGRVQSASPIEGPVPGSLVVGGASSGQFVLQK